MTNRERLQENYEDALFALLMDDVAQTEGKRLIRENEALQADPNAAVPADIDRRCMQVIQRTLAKRKHDVSLKKLCQQICRVAVIAAIITSLFISAYAFSPSFRTGTLNLLLDIDDKLATWRFDDGSLPQLPKGTDGTTKVGFNISNIPSNYTITGIESFPGQTHLQYKNAQGELLDIDIFDVNAADTFTYDVEDADYYEEVPLDGVSAIVLDKNGVVSIAWADTEQNTFFYMFSTDMSIDVLIEFAGFIRNNGS